MNVEDHDMIEVKNSLQRIEGKISQFETFYQQGLGELGRLNKALESLDATIQRSMAGLITQASGIVPGGLIPIRMALVMVVVALGISNAKDIGEHVITLVHAIMGVR